MLLAGDVVGEERIAVAFALLLACERRLPAGVEIDRGVSFEASEPHGCKVSRGLRTRIPAPMRSQGSRPARFANRYCPGPAGRIWL
ncbi:hypothetical protein CBM2598_U30125 [Cupriavidus taiwanensis]|nr:hypothetical protein CBM2598_U30125 [Cupriavidus taiwanensis]